MKKGKANTKLVKAVGSLEDNGQRQLTTTLQRRALVKVFKCSNIIQLHIGRGRSKNDEYKTITDKLFE